METQPLCRLFFLIIWMFVVLLHRVRSQEDLPRLSLESRVFVGLNGNDLTISCEVKKAANQSADILRCYDPGHNQIYVNVIPSTADSAQTFTAKVTLNHLNRSGEYHCQYQTARAFWFLYVRDKNFKLHAKQDFTEFILVAVFTAVLLIFSVVGSVYVFRGHWITKCRQTDKEEKQNNKEVQKKGSKMKEDSVNAVTDPSTSFYASLEPRTRSIYDELHPSPANMPDQQRANPKKKQSHQTKQQNTPNRDEDQFESVYENY